MTDYFMIVPGETPELPDTDPARWLALCTCGEVHSITFTKYWDEGDDQPTEHWCFVCPEQGLHFRLEAHAPYTVTKTVTYRIQSNVTPSKLDGEALMKYFE